jgi:hypothetical protein
MAKRWFAEIADVRIHYPLIMVVRDNSGENTSKELNDFFTSHGVKNYFSIVRTVAKWFGRIIRGIRIHVG